MPIAIRKLWRVSAALSAIALARQSAFEPMTVALMLNVAIGLWVGWG